MGLFSAMNASVSGLGATGQAISVISDNLANTNTIGYKASNTLFSQLVTNAGAGGTAYNSGGVGVAVLRDQSSQGSFISSSSKTDLAISGNGFFKVADNSINGSDTSFYYTRAGSFSENKEGYLTNPDGYYLQGWKTDSDGNILDIQNPQAIELQSVGVSAQRTNKVELVANLTSTEDKNVLYDTSNSLATTLASFVADPTTVDYIADIRVYDAQGGARDMSVLFTKRADNLWDFQIVTDGGNIQGGTSGTDTAVAHGVLEFTTTGTLKYATLTDATGSPLDTMDVDITWAGGVDPSTITFNFGSYSGGNILNSTTGLGYATQTSTSGTADIVTSSTVANLSDISTDGTTAAGTYTIRRLNATTLELVDSLGAQVGTATIAGVGASQTVTFNDTVPASIGVTISTNASFDNSAFNNGDTLGTVVFGTTATTGGVTNIAAENDILGTGTYQLVRTSNTTIELRDSSGTYIATASMATSGVRDIYFATQQLRVSVSADFDPDIGAVNTFTLTAKPQLDEGIGSDGVTQLAGSYNTKSVNQNGFGAGTISSINVDENGFVNGTFTNGETKKLYKIALAVFQNPNALELVSGSLLRVTDESGEALLKQAGIGGTGRLVSGSLEGSTADIATEFSHMIVAQRAFQASSKVITTVDQMLNELLQLR